MCDQHFFDAGYARAAIGGTPAPARCEWNGRTKRCELSKASCLVLPSLPPSATCAERKLAFVHINRAAGSSISIGLGSCQNATERWYYDDSTPTASSRPARPAVKVGGSSGGTASTALSVGHLTAKDYLSQWRERTGACAAQRLSVGQCSHAFREAVYSFAVVRNPYDRQVSLFHALLERECAPTRHNPATPARQCEVRHFPFVNASWRDSLDGRAAHFRRWVRALDSAYPVGSPRNPFFTSMAAIERRSDASQLAWIEDAAGDVAVSAVLKFEDNLQHAFARLSHECLHCSLSLPHALASASHQASRWADYYDDASATIVRQQTIRDFHAFGYSETIDRTGILE